MKLCTNVMLFEQVFGLKKTIDIFSQAGFDGIDFNSDLPEHCSSEHDAAYYQEIRSYAADKGIVFTQAHAPFASSFPDEERSRLRFEEILRGMQRASWLGAEMLVVHPCNHLKHRKKDHHQILLDYNLDFYRKLIPYAQDAGIRIAIENIPGSITEDAEGLKELFRALSHPVFTICFDVGHAQIMHLNPAEMIRQLGNDIGCTHIHDNDGISDLHTLPFYGVIDWYEVMKAFADVSYQGNLSYEAGLFVKNLPDSMRPIAAKYMADVGRHLIEQFCRAQCATNI